MKFEPYENVPLFLQSEGGEGEFIFAESASIAVSQGLNVNRQVDDNVFQIISYVDAAGSDNDLQYEPFEFQENVPVLVLLGPSGGPPVPIATSIHEIPKDTEIKFADGKSLFFEHSIKPDGHQYIASVYATSGEWSLSADEAQEGYFDPIFKYSTNSPIAGSLDVSFYPNTGNLPSFFNITGLLDPTQFPPVNEEKVMGHIGPFEFTDAYLKSFDFSISPNSMIQANASFDIYGQLTKDEDFVNNYFDSELYKQQSIPHGEHTQIIGTNDLGFDHTISFAYSLNVSRTPRVEAPTTANNSNASLGLVPSRVTKKSVTINMSLQGENLDPDMLVDGFGGKRANLRVKLYDLSYQDFGSDEAFSQENTAGFMNEFVCNGVIESQALSINSQGHLVGAIEVSETIK